MNDLYRMLTKVWSPGTTPAALVALIQAKTRRLNQYLDNAAVLSESHRKSAGVAVDRLEAIEMKAWETWEVGVTDDPVWTLMCLLTHPQEIELLKLLTEGED